MLSRCNFLYYIYLLPTIQVWGKVVFSQASVSHSVHGGGRGLCMMSLPVWLPGPMFLLEGLCLWCHVPPRGVFVLCPPDRDPTYGEERAVRILLECFLVTNVCLCFAVS